MLPGSEGGPWAIVLAAGSGSRFGALKQFALLGGAPVAQWSVDTAWSVCAGVVLVVPPGPAGSSGSVVGPAAIVSGGASRAQSVRAGLAAVPDIASSVLVHDAARPLASAQLWASVAASVNGGADAAIPCLAVNDTVKQRSADGSLRTLDRSAVVAAQTPQGFKLAVLRHAHARQAEATDDGALVEEAGCRVVAVPGERFNFKITDQWDLWLAGHCLSLVAPAGPGSPVAGPSAL